MPFCYLIQPCELVGTQRYKIGMSSLSDLSRLKSYKKGSRYICFFEHEDALALEKVLISEFDKRYKLIAGREYYHVDDETEMISLFMRLVLGFKKSEQKAVEESRNLDWGRFRFRQN